MSFYKRLAGFTCLAIGLGIAIGAFGAHKMQEHLTAKQLNTYSTAVRYWFYNSLGLLALAAIGQFISISKSGIVIIAAGTCTFCVSLWLNAILGIKVFGMVAPVGGITMILGWLITAFQIFKAK